jgi:hypothetical protein
MLVIILKEILFIIFTIYSGMCRRSPDRFRDFKFFPILKSKSDRYSLLINRRKCRISSVRPDSSDNLSIDNLKRHTLQAGFSRLSSVDLNCVHFWNQG